ncbi:hypothetical protein JL721_6741 [Aureococcus anophagefferens]|nr:hypothetical protein JL721_6741 [Aureococcus anophagefferens]
MADPASMAYRSFGLGCYAVVVRYCTMPLEKTAMIMRAGLRPGLSSALGVAPVVYGDQLMEDASKDETAMTTADALKTAGKLALVPSSPGAIESASPERATQRFYGLATSAAVEARIGANAFGYKAEGLGAFITAPKWFSRVMMNAPIQGTMPWFYNSVPPRRGLASRASPALGTVAPRAKRPSVTLRGHGSGRERV